MGEIPWTAAEVGTYGAGAGTHRATGWRRRGRGRRRGWGRVVFAFLALLAFLALPTFLGLVDLGMLLSGCRLPEAKQPCGPDEQRAQGPTPGAPCTEGADQGIKTFGVHGRCSLGLGRPAALGNSDSDA